MVQPMAPNISKKWGDAYKQLRGKVDILVWSDDTDSSTARDLVRAGGCLAPASGDTTGYRMRTGYGTPRLMMAIADTEDAAGATACYLHNNKEVRNILFGVPFDLSDFSTLDFMDIGGCPFEEGSDLYVTMDQTTGAANQNTVLAMIYYDGLPEKDIIVPGELAEQVVVETLSVTPVANTLSFPGDDVLTGYVAGADLPGGSKNRYALLKLQDIFTTISDSVFAVRHPVYTDHIFAIPTTRAIYSQNWWDGPGWKFNGDELVKVGVYGQAGGAAIVGVMIAVLP